MSRLEGTLASLQDATSPTPLLALAWAGAWRRETGGELALGAAVLQITGWARRVVGVRELATNRP